MTQATTAAPTASPYDLIGGAQAVRGLVERFYDLMDAEPEFAELRHLHAPDLSPMRDSLAGFLTGWLGGPRDWFESNPGKCMMSAHRAVPIDQTTAGQWVAAMNQALSDSAIEPEFAARLGETFIRMAAGMVRA